MTDYRELIERLEHQAKGDKWHCAALAVTAITTLSAERDEARTLGAAYAYDKDRLQTDLEAAEARLAKAVEVMRWIASIDPDDIEHDRLSPEEIWSMKLKAAVNGARSFLASLETSNV